MRTILLLCSLAPFAAAARPTEREHPTTGCGAPYECYAPDFCVDNTLADVIQNPIVKISETKNVYKDCPALVTIFPYRKYWAEVTIESITTDTQSIVLIQTDLSTNTVRNEFSCAVDNSDPNDPKITQTYTGKKPIGPESSPKTVAPIKCVFQIKLGPQQDLFENKKRFNLQFKINSNSKDLLTENTGFHGFVLQEGCDFSNIEFNKGESPNHVYAQIQQEKATYFCKDPKFEMEYKSEKAPDSGYKKGVTLICDIKKDPIAFKVGSEWVTYPDIRCVAEAKYFCNYEPKVKANERKLDYKPSDWNAQKRSTLKCPDEYPYLFVKGKPVLDSTIECLNYGGSQIWTVMKDKQKLAKNGVEAYCAKEVPCEIMYKLTQSKIPNGQVSHEFYPMCHGDGVLKDMHDQLATKFSCDKKTGTYKYFSGGNEIDLKDVTFKCIYPDVEKRNDAERTRINNKVTYWSVGVGVGSGVIILIGCIASTFVGRHVHKKAKAKRQAEKMKDNEAKYLQFAMNKEERAKDARRHHVKPQSELSEASDTIKWSDMSLEARYEGLTKINPREGTLAEKRIDKSYPVLSLTPDLVPKHKLHTAELPAKFSERRLPVEIEQIQRHRDDVNPKYTSYLPYGFQQRKKCNLVVENSK